MAEQPPAACAQGARQPAEQGRRRRRPGSFWRCHEPHPGGDTDHGPDHKARRSYQRIKRIVHTSLLLIFCLSCSPTAPRDPASLGAHLDAQLPTVIAAGNSPSIQVAVVSQGQAIWSRACGQDSGPDRVYMNASVQKLFTATAVLQLVERGLFDLDANVSSYVLFAVRHPDYPDTPVAVRLLLAHPSGLDSFPCQFDWDTESTFSPQSRSACSAHLQATAQRQ